MKREYVVALGYAVSLTMFGPEIAFATAGLIFLASLLIPQTPIIEKETGDKYYRVVR